MTALDPKNVPIVNEPNDIGEIIKLLKKRIEELKNMKIQGFRLISVFNVFTIREAKVAEYRGGEINNVYVYVLRNELDEIEKSLLLHQEKISKLEQILLDYKGIRIFSQYIDFVEHLRYIELIKKDNDAYLKSKIPETIPEENDE